MNIGKKKIIEKNEKIILRLYCGMLSDIGISSKTPMSGFVVTSVKSLLADVSAIF